ncbi:MAG: fasciclin domain-containing protein [Prolixibacteraceae bacterium]
MKQLLLILVLVFTLFSCSDKWDEYYATEDNEEISPLSLYDYFEGEPAYSKFFELLKDQGVADQLSADQELTVWAVKDELYDISVAGSIEHRLVAQYHVNHLMLKRSDFKHGLRIPMLNGIYLTITLKGDESMVNGVNILSGRRFKNGVVYEIESVLKPLTNMLDYILLLDDSYSMLRDSVAFYNKQTFDKKNSTPIGVDLTGNTLYDSVFYTYNPMFDTIDISSEFEQLTMFLPNNEVISGALQKLNDQYKLMGKTLALYDSTLAMTWIRQAIFQKGIITDYGSVLDLTSPFGKVWRTSVQHIDEASVQQLSNGIVYNLTELKIPNNVIIDRIKSLVHYYEYLSPEQQTALYTLKGATTFQILKGDESPVSGFYYWLFEVVGNEDLKDEFSVEFTPLDFNIESGEVSIMKVPPGEYNLYMGFRSKGHPYVDIYFHSGAEAIPDNWAPVATEIPAANSTPWNYDRVNETDPNIKKWNGLGGLVGVVNVTGNEMSTFRIKVKFNKLEAIGASKKMQLYHWTLKPTENNY